MEMNKSFKEPDFDESMRSAFLFLLKLQLLDMDAETAKTARDSLELAFNMSNILDTGLDRHTLAVLIALCELGLKPEALATVVKELQREPSWSTPTAAHI